MQVALTHPEVVTPVKRSVSTFSRFKTFSRSVLKKALGDCLVIQISLLINLKSECISCDFFPSSKQDKAGTFL